MKKFSLEGIYQNNDIPTLKLGFKQYYIISIVCLRLQMIM